MLKIEKLNGSTARILGCFAVCLMVVGWSGYFCVVGSLCWFL
jgi:hypothetical protein